MSELALELSGRGYQVKYISEKKISRDRILLGWECIGLDSLDYVLVSGHNEIFNLISESPLDSIHICEGIRGNGIVGIAQKELSRNKRIQWVVMETVNINGVLGLIRRIIYRYLLFKKNEDINLYLAIGKSTKTWLIKNGVPEERVCKFSYFLSNKLMEIRPKKNPISTFTFVYVGQLVKRKNVKLIIDAMKEFADQDVELLIVGSGALERCLKNYSNDILGNKVIWTGSMQMQRVYQTIADSDCLILPSLYDGWGAVIAESLMVGTPVICSDACGASDLITCSKMGEVFKSNNLNELIMKMKIILENGPVGEEMREAIRKSAHNLFASQGAKFFEDVLSYSLDLVEKKEFYLAGNER